MQRVEVLGDGAGQGVEDDLFDAVGVARVAGRLQEIGECPRVVGDVAGLMHIAGIPPLHVLGAGMQPIRERRLLFEFGVAVNCGA